MNQKRYRKFWFSYYVIGSCSASQSKVALTISATCPGYKEKLRNSWPWESLNRCCDVVKNDSECSETFFIFPVSGKCVCEKKGHSCPRIFGFSTEMRLKSSKYISSNCKRLK